MLKAFIIALIAISGTRQACGEGCLKCNTNGDCLVADLSTNYYLNGTTAAKVTIENCQLVTHNGKCASCKEGYFIDAATNKCAAVPTTSVITNCSLYSSNSTCSLCKKDYYLNVNACTAVETKLANCDYYSTATTCAVCAKGYLLSLDAKNCVAAPTTANCDDYSFVQCKTCESGYVLNHNNYLKSTLLSSNDAEKGVLALFALRLKDGMKNSTAQGACQEVSTKYCSVFDQGTNTCTTCSSTYYLDKEKMCIAFPDEPIENCLHYSGVKTCKECVAGYYFKSGICTEITGTAAIANCATYDGTASSVKCNACSADYYLSSNACSSKRVKSLGTAIANCATKDPVADKCLTCASGYQISSDGLECFANINNCSAYNSVASGQKLTCKTCNVGYYIKTGSDSSTTCELGTVDNCSTYSDAEGKTCTLCKNGYLLKNAKCEPHNDIKGCTTYSTTSHHACNVCTNTANFNFVVKKNCQTVATKVENCATYSGDISAPTCASCNSGYYLDGTTCKQVTIQNCNALDANNLCVSCKQGFALRWDKKECITTFGYMNDQCAVDSTTDSANIELAKAVTCTYCKEHAMPFDFKDHYVCMNNKEIQNIAGINDDTKIIPGCVKYNATIQCVQCDVDGDKPYLDAATASPTCVAACPSGAYFKYTLDIKRQIDQFNLCIAATSEPAKTKTTCAAFAPNLSVDFSAGTKYSCVKCKDNHLPELDPIETEYTNVDPNATKLKDFFPSPNTKYPGVFRCSIADANTKIGGVVQKSMPYCEYYTNAGAPNEFHCQRCKVGATGTLSSTGNMTACAVDSNCSSDIYHNYDMQINNLLSCHKCSGNTIPFIFYKGLTGDVGGTTTITPKFQSFAAYKVPLISDGTFSDAAGTEKHIACRENKRENFGIPDGKYGVVENCAIGVMLTNVTNGEYDTTTKKFGSTCAACKPGYKATNYDLLPYIKTKCDPILNCAANTNMVNGCSQCNTGFVLKYDKASLKVDYETCLTVPTTLTDKLANCYAAEPNATTATNADACGVCSKGYFLNKDGACEKIQPYKCVAESFRFFQTVDFKQAEYALAFQSNGVGCNKCESGYNAVQIASTHNACVNSSYVNTKVDNIKKADTKYVPYCKHYSAADAAGLKCNTCDTNYVINGTSKDECYPNTSITNCADAISATECKKCVSTAFGLKNKKCEAGNIPNCIAYEHAFDSTAVKCTRCAADYYYDSTSNTCKLGLIHNCDRLKNDAPKSCDQCKENHIKVSNIKDSYDYCYPNDSTLGCSTADIVTGTNGGEITCTACTNSSSQVTGALKVDVTQTICMNFHLITNCKAYDISNTLSLSNFTCTACNDGFFLENNRCKERVNKPSKCSKYVVGEDKCAECDNTSYLDDGSKKCTEYPKGILGCRTYSDATTCTACHKGRYLSNNTCPKVTTAITNCTYYSANNVCSACDDTYVLINNACNKATASNCATYTSVTACATCKAGHVLETNNSVTNCVAKTKTGCAVLDINSPYNCLECSGNYYLEAGECKSPTTITNCIAYDSKTTCAKCKQGFALSADKASCSDAGSIKAFIDAKCAEAQAVATPTCSRCDAGYYFVNGACTGNCNSSSASGCLACDPKAPATCYICQTGYYQDKAGKCNALVVPDKDKNAMIMGVMTLLVAFMSLMF